MRADAATMPSVRFLSQGSVILLAGSLVGMGLNVASPRPLSLARPVYPASASGTSVCTGGDSAPAKGAAHSRVTITQEEAVKACALCSAGFVDARAASAFALGHIPGAVHLPPRGHDEEEAALGSLRRLQTLVVYDAGGGCRLSEGVADRLRSQGFRDVRILLGTFATWQATGGPAESGACESCGTSGLSPADVGNRPEAR